MKNYNRRSSHGHHGSKRRELAQHAHSTWIAHMHSHTYINTVTTTSLCEAVSSVSYYRIWNLVFLLKVGLPGFSVPWVRTCVGRRGGGGGVRGGSGTNKSAQELTQRDRQKAVCVCAPPLPNPPPPYPAPPLPNPPPLYLAPPLPSHQPST